MQTEQNKNKKNIRTRFSELLLYIYIKPAKQNNNKIKLESA